MNDERKGKLIRVYETLSTDKLREIISSNHNGYYDDSLLIKAELLRRNIPENELPSNFKIKRRVLLTNLKAIFVLGFFLLCIGLFIFASCYDFKSDTNSSNTSSRESNSSEVDLKVSMGQICFPEYKSTEGKLLFNEIQRKNNGCEMSPVLTSLGEDNRLIIFIPTDEYSKLSLKDKRKIMNYASSLIPDAKKYPFDYSIIPSTAPIFKTKPNLMDNSTRKMTYKSCAIAVGPIKEGNYYKRGGDCENVYGKYVAEEQLIYPNDLE